MKLTVTTTLTCILFVSLCNAQGTKTTKSKTSASQPAVVKVLKPVTELADNKETWQKISVRTMVARNKVEVLPKENLRADNALYQAQIPESDPIGAVIHN